MVGLGLVARSSFALAANRADDEYADDVIEEFPVTARKRSESFSVMPASFNVMCAVDLAMHSVTCAVDLAVSIVPCAVDLAVCRVPCAVDLAVCRVPCAVDLAACCVLFAF